MLVKPVEIPGRKIPAKYCSVSQESPEGAEKMERPNDQLDKKWTRHENNCIDQKPSVPGFPRTASKNPQCLVNDNKKCQSGNAYEEIREQRWMPYRCSPRIKRELSTQL